MTVQIHRVGVIAVDEVCKDAAVWCPHLVADKREGILRNPRWLELARCYGKGGCGRLLTARPYHQILGPGRGLTRQVHRNFRRTPGGHDAWFVAPTDGTRRSEAR